MVAASAPFIADSESTGGDSIRISVVGSSDAFADFSAGGEAGDEADFTFDAFAFVVDDFDEVGVLAVAAFFPVVVLLPVVVVSDALVFDLEELDPEV